MKTKDLRKKPPDQPGAMAEQEELLPERNAELLHKKEVEDTCLKVYAEVEKGFSDQWERSNSQMDYWDIYNCELGPRQFYSGNSKIFVPIVADAVDARKTRFTNQIFPMTGKNVEVISNEQGRPQALMSLLEFYIRKSRLRSVVVPALMKNGDVEGQYNVMMHWIENRRYVAYRVTEPDTVEGEEELALPDDDEEGVEDIREEEVVSAFPMVEVLPDADVLILPATCATSEEAINNGGSVTVLRRYTESKLEEMIADGEIDEDKGNALLDQMKSKQATQNPDKKKKITDAAGIKGDGAGVVAYLYQTWTKLTLKNEEGEEEKRLCRIWFGGEDAVLSCKRNPYWCDHVPIISAPADRTEGSAKGRSRIKRIETIQYAANDAINEAMDSATYALLPIVMTDPVKNPRTGSMILNVAAIWETDPKSTSFAQFPPLWKDGFEIVSQAKAQIFQSLGVNPAMLPMSGSGGSKGDSKTNQAKVAQEQQIDLLMTADAVIGISDDILTPVLRWFVYLDHQFRDHALTVRQFGMLGHEANMEVILPVQMDRRFEVRWFGVEAMRSIQQMQQQMAGLNVVRGIPPQQYKGYELNLAPVLQQFMENLFGPALARQTFVDLKAKLSMEAEFENQLLASGFRVPVSEMDDDVEHIKTHMQLMQGEGDPSGNIRLHMMAHRVNMEQKMKQMQMQQQQIGAQGVPGGAGPGVPGQPRQGAQTGGPRGGQQPPGAIHNDRMQGADVVPRARGAA